MLFRLVREQKLKEVRISLNGEDFRNLVRGGELSQYVENGTVLVQVMLSDIGFDIMKSYIDEAERRSHEEAEEASSGHSPK